MAMHLVVVFSLQRPEFSTRLVHVMDKVELRQVFIQALKLPPANYHSTNPPLSSIITGIVRHTNLRSQVSGTCYQEQKNIIIKFSTFLSLLTVDLYLKMGEGDFLVSRATICFIRSIRGPMQFVG
jgi:hypothetical protein